MPANDGSRLRVDEAMATLADMRLLLCERQLARLAASDEARRIRAESRALRARVARQRDAGTIQVTLATSGAPRERSDRALSLRRQ
jgi:hypothetical protein